mgnify:CR=1 FL=1
MIYLQKKYKITRKCQKNISLHKQSLHTFWDSIKSWILIIINDICKIESIYIQKKAVIILGYVYSLSILDYLNYQFTGARLTGIVIQRAPPPPRGSSAASKVTTKRS